MVEQLNEQDFANLEALMSGSDPIVNYYSYLESRGIRYASLALE
jgi:hypothetical protein